MARIAVIGVPTNGAGTADGVALAPTALRNAGLIERLSHVADVLDTGDVQFIAPSPSRDEKTGIIAPKTMVSMIVGVDAAVNSALEQGRFPLVLGGDCGLLLGCLNAARRLYGQAGLLFVDGHEDTYPPHQSPTGESADMEMGFALGCHIENLPDTLATMLPLITPADVAMLGVRDAEVLKSEGVASLAHALSVRMVDDGALMQGAATEITQASLAYIGAGQRRWWLHTDLDVLTVEALAAVDYHQPGGLSWDVLTQIARVACRTEGIVGWDITIYNPDLDTDGQQARRIIEYIEAVIRG
ncbi:MAG: arginase family protein [Chloroflexi bacterium]|nr:arginase family protein [Chloroflexota bacterium]